jgi:WD40 repeat protein
MGDAVGDGDVRTADPEDTIDASPASDATLPAPAADPPAEDYGELLAVERHHYVVEGEIAKGGMGRVIAARDRRLGRAVAIKELLPKNRDATRRFEREARITARLQHPAIIHVYEAGVWPGGEPFYAMHKVAGRSLDKVVAERATLIDRLGLLPNVIAVADALAYAHSEHVIHRDLKPSNVLVGEFGETVVIDWGLAKDLDAADLGDSLLRPRTGSDETMSGSVVGTPAYMPPEQARGESVDERADVYALGALLYKVLVGHAPYGGATSKEIVDQVIAGPPQPVDEREPGTPADLAAIVRKAMARDREQRYSTAGELAADLKRFQTGQLVAAHRYTAGQLFWRWLRRRLLAVTIGVMAIVAIAVIAVISLQRIIEEKARAEERRRVLLAQRAWAELFDGHAGKALALLAAAARDGRIDDAHGFLIADAKRPFADTPKEIAGRSPVAVSPDGKHIATADANKIALSRSSDGEPEQTLDLGVHVSIRALAWDNANAQLAAGGDDGTVWVWRHGEPITLRGHRLAIRDVAFDATGTQLVSASDDGTARVWDLATAMPFPPSKCHDRAVVTAEFSRDGERVVTASEDHTACVWGAHNGEIIRQLQGHSAALESARWANHDRWIVTASDDGTARVWSAERGKLVFEPLTHLPGSAVRVAIVSHDGRHVLTAGTDRVANLWALPATAPEDGTEGHAWPAGRLAGHTDAIVNAAFSDDDSLVATGSLDHTATIWDPKRGDALASFPHGGVVDSVAFTAETRLVTGCRDGHTRIWNTDTHHLPKELDSPIHAIAAAKGVVAIGTEDSNVTVLRDGKPQVLNGHMTSVLALAMDKGGTVLVSGGEDARPIVWDIAHDKLIRELGSHTAPIRAIAIDATGKLVATASGNDVRLFGLGDGTLLRVLHTDHASFTAVAFAPNGQLVIGDDDGTVKLWDPVLDATIASWPLLPTAVTAIALSPDESLVVASASHVVIYSLADFRRGNAKPIELDNPGEVVAVAFTTGGWGVVTGTDDGAKIWDVATGKLLGTRGAHGRAVDALAIAGDTLWLASGDSDGTLGDWDIHSETNLETLAQFVSEHDPWMLDENDDVVQKRRSDGQRGSDSK